MKGRKERMTGRACGWGGLASIFNIYTHFRKYSCDPLFSFFFFFNASLPLLTHSCPLAAFLRALHLRELDSHSSRSLYRWARQTDALRDSCVGLQVDHWIHEGVRQGKWTCNFVDMWCYAQKNIHDVRKKETKSCQWRDITQLHLFLVSQSTCHLTCLLCRLDRWMDIWSGG